MNAVAEAAQVGPTTLYSYYKTKEKLVVSISGMVWSEVWQQAIARRGVDGFSKQSAMTLLRFYTDRIIALYRERPLLLRFSGNYKTFINRQHTKVEDLKEHLDPLKLIQAVFHQAYVRAQTDHSIRTDIPEDVLFTSVAVGMLALAERYTQGIVWASRGEEDHTQELIIAQEMILNWCAGTGAQDEQKEETGK